MISDGSRGGAAAAPPPPLFLDQTVARRVKKIIFGDRPLPRLSKGLESEASTPLRWRSINSPWFIFYHARSTDFEEKIEGL